MSIELRDYQHQIVDEVRGHIKTGVKSILIQLPTGGGKTAIAATMIGNAIRKNYRAWFNVHRRELIYQCIRTFQKVGIPHGIISADSFMDRKKLAQIASVQTLARRLDRLQPPNIIVWDEAHHLAAANWAKIFKQYPDCLHIGLSATPKRLDGSGLRPFFEVMVKGPSTRWLIDHGHLSEFRMFSVGSINMDGVHHQAGDFKRTEVLERLAKSTVMGDVVSHYCAHAHGRRALVFEASIERSQNVAQMFNSAGIPAMHVDGDTDEAVRDRAMRDLECGQLKVLCNVDLFGEGVDVPTVEAVHLCRPTDSLTLYLQQIGRGLRPAPGKEHCLIFDHAGNLSRHGAPDMAREWSLEYDRDKRKKKNGPLENRKCMDCYADNKPGAKVCEFCGKTFPVASREINQIDGELQEINVAMMKHEAMQAQSMSKDYDSLVALGRMRKMKNPEGWARHIMDARQKKSESKRMARSV